MVIRVVFTNVTEKIQAIKFIRAITGMGLRDAKDLVDALDANRGKGVGASITGEYRFHVDAAKALMGLLPQLNDDTYGKFPYGVRMYPETTDIIDCR